MRTVRVRDVVLGRGRPAIIVPVAASDVAGVLRRLDDLDGHPVDVVEWRADRLAGVGDPDEIRRATREVVSASRGRPVLATVRTRAEGGEADVDDAAYGAAVRALVEGGADLVDVEVARGCAADLVRFAHAAGTPVVGSSHDFTSTPSVVVMVERLRRAQELGVDVSKLAVTPRDTGDVLDLLAAAWQMRSRWADRPFIAISMGASGLVSRLAAETVGSCATFASVGEASAPGQVDADRLADVIDLVHRAR